MDGLKRGTIFERCAGQSDERGTRVVVSRKELERLGMNARVFYELPKEVQLEQLANRRFEKSFGGERGTGNGSGGGRRKGKGRESVSPKKGVRK